MTSPIRLAIIGCGAMSELGHLPALRNTDAIAATVLIDTDGARASALAAKFGIAHHSTDLADAARYAEAACVVVPHHVHADVATRLIDAGLHILIEKPLAIRLEDCDAIIAAAERRRVVLAVAMVRRFARTTRLLKNLIEQRTFGAARTFRLVSGVSGTWPTKSAYALDAAQSGGGVLMVNGVHDLDLLAALFDHPVPESLVFCADADFGRHGLLESDATLRMTTLSGTTGEVELSRTRDLANGLTIEFERAHVHAPLFGDELTVTLPEGAPMRWSGRIDEPGSTNRQDFNAMLTTQLDDFAAAISGKKRPEVDGREGRRVIETVTRCYADVRPLDLPWRQPVAVPEAA